MDEKKTSYREYTEEFKLEALELLKSSGKSAGQIERDLGITPGLLVKWRLDIKSFPKESSKCTWRQAILKLPKGRSNDCNGDWQKWKKNARS